MSAESQYEEGALYRATVRGVPGVIVDYVALTDRWRSLGTVALAWVHTPDLVTDITGPLRVLGPDERVVEPGHVVLDLAGLKMYATDTWSDVAHYMSGDGRTAKIVARQIQAQTTPPRIPEPEWGEVVEAGVKQHDLRLRWVRVNNANTSGVHWLCEDTNEYPRAWLDLIEPKVVDS